MLPSKLRSGNIEFQQKNPPFGVSKTFSTSKNSKGNPLTPEINPKSSISSQRKPTPEKRIFRVSEMQQQMGQLENELKMMKVKLGATEEERDRAVDELKKVAKETNLGVSDQALSNAKVADIYTELNSMIQSLSDAKQELKIKENYIESLKLELGKAKELEVILVEKNASLNKLKEDLSNLKLSEAQVTGLLTESKKRIQELENELEKGKKSESKTLESFIAQTEELQQTKISLEESKLELKSLHAKIKKLEDLSSQSFRKDDKSTKGEMDILKNELRLTKEKLGKSQESEKLSSMKSRSLLEEMELLKNEVKLATEAEENSRKAMDDLALALKEVATESSHAKEKLGQTEEELDRSKGEIETLKMKLKSIEEKYKAVSDEARKEADRYKNTAERLRLEAEESLLAWNGKETGFVGCIKKAEEEKSIALESLREAENKNNAAKLENQKLRDILKQALNEANVAKEAAEIAREENSQLKDTLAQKDDALDLLSRENESLKINQASAFESINGLKRLLSEASTKESNYKSQNSMDKEHKEGKKLGKNFSFNLKELMVMHKHKGSVEEHKVVNKQIEEDEDFEQSDPLRGSIFDTEETPPSTKHHRKNSSFVFTDDADTINSDDFDHLDASHFDDTEIRARKKKALLRRFGDIIRRKSVQRRESSPE